MCDRETPQTNCLINGQDVRVISVCKWTSLLTKCTPVLTDSSGVAILKAGHLSKVSSQTSGPVLRSTSTLLTRAHSQTESFSLKVCVLLLRPRVPTYILCQNWQSTFSSISSVTAGRKVWAFSGYDLVRGYPKKLSSVGLPRYVRSIDAALYDVESGKTLFFVGNYYFRCNFEAYYIVFIHGKWLKYEFFFILYPFMSLVMMRPRGLWTKDSLNVLIRPSLAWPAKWQLLSSTEVSLHKIIDFPGFKVKVSCRAMKICCMKEKVSK